MRCGGTGSRCRRSATGSRHGGSPRAGRARRGRAGRRAFQVARVSLSSTWKNRRYFMQQRKKRLKRRWLKMSRNSRSPVRRRSHPPGGLPCKTWEAARRARRGPEGRRHPEARLFAIGLSISRCRPRGRQANCPADPQVRFAGTGAGGVLGHLRGMAQKAQQPQDLEERVCVTFLQQLRRQISG